eukprot:7947510-Alexandrium_andersonii.AAC.1
MHRTPRTRLRAACARNCADAQRVRQASTLREGRQVERRTAEHPCADGMCADMVRICKCI